MEASSTASRSDPNPPTEATEAVSSPIDAQPSDQRMPRFAAGYNGLLPAIAQDAATGRVLMLAWMNEQAFAETLSTGFAVYYSRSRGRLWRKGETSGHRQRVTEIRVDCDEDTILLQVQQTGAACHEGYESCFFRALEPDGEAKIVDERLVDPADVYGRSD